jgi:membrane protease YdiL (CAAX protease family)
MPWDIWLILLVLATIIPWRGRIRLKQLLAKPRVEPRERISLYLSTIAFQWIAAGIAGWRAWAHGYTNAELGLGTGPNLFRSVIAAVGGTIVLAGLHWLNFRRMGSLLDKLPVRVQAMATRILPQSAQERVSFLALAITAGCCEEFLYRGFTMAAFARAGFPIWASVVVSSILFGAAHLYQGRGGLIGTGILGILFGTFRAFTGSLLPVAAWHAAVDVVAGIAGPRYLIQKKPVIDSPELPETPFR